MAKFRNEVSEIRERTVRQAHRNACPPRSSHRSPRTSTDGLQDREFYRQTRAYLKTTFRELPMMLTLVSVLGYWLSLKAEVRSLVPALALMGGLPHPGFHRQTRGEILTAPPGVQMRRVCARTPPRVTAHDDAVALSVPLPCLLLILINEILFCSVLFFSHPRSEGWPHHGRAFSIYLCPLSF